MTSALTIAQRKASELAAPFAQGNTMLREYTVRYRIVESVDGQGDACEYCQAASVYANTYLRDMDGDEVTFGSCRLCVFPAIDGVYDTDPSFVVTVEMPQ